MNDIVYRNEHDSQDIEKRWERASSNRNRTKVQHLTIKQVARPPRLHSTEPLSILRVGGLDYQPRVQRWNALPLVQSTVMLLTFRDNLLSI